MYELSTKSVKTDATQRIFIVPTKRTRSRANIKWAPSQHLAYPQFQTDFNNKSK